MAAFFTERGGSRSSLFHGALSTFENLPGGACNYRDLNLGTQAPLCGCQRFYLNAGQHAPDGATEWAWCFCGHHACFHNAFIPQQRMPEHIPSTPSKMNNAQEQGTETHEHTSSAISSQHNNMSMSKLPTGLGIRSNSQSQSQSINTRVWQALNEFARNQDDGNASLTTSKLPSTAAASVVDESRSSPSRQEQSRAPMYRVMGPPVNIPQTLLPKATEDYSATEIATPSVAGTPDFRAIAPQATAMRAPPQLVRPKSADARVPQSLKGGSQRHSPMAFHQATSIQDLRDLMRTYSHRLEALESLSFSQVPAEEIQDRFELFDGRILDLEHWRAEQDKQTSSPEIGQASSHKRRRLLPDEMGSFISDASYDSNAAAQTETVVLATLAANAETHPRIDALESRVADLEDAAQPSYAHPWQVEVVLLPWSRELRGVWFSSHESTQNSLRSATQASEEWTSAQAGASLSFQSSVNGAWTTQSIEAWANEAKEWLSPKACGPNGTVFQRLASRGLVKDITLTTSDARHLLRTIRDAFGEHLSGQEVVSEQSRTYTGLLERFVPLRKIRKSSRLRFLDPPEMMTCAVWTTRFLDASVFMKTGNGQRRLYVTTPDAYVQPANSCPITWEHIREFSSRPAEAEEPLSQHVSDEDCWTYHKNLDQSISVHSSFSQWSTRSQLAEVDAQQLEQTPISPWSEPGAVHQRTVSLPTSTTTSAQMQEAIPQRRIASFGAPMKHYAEDSLGVEIIAKRRRLSPSPEAERRGVNFTPRWSREPPSPFTSEGALENKSQSAGSRKRGLTPFAYATPHSNSNHVGRTELIPGDGDTEADTDIIGPDSEPGEEEWEGMADEEIHVSHDSGPNADIGSREQASMYDDDTE